MGLLNKFTIIGAILLFLGLIFSGFLFTITGAPLLEDSYIDESNPDMNYGSSAELEVKAGWVGTDRKISFVKFNIQVPTINTTINGAELEMTVLNRGNNQIYVCANRIEEDWSQSVVTWNNQPSYDTQSDENCFMEMMAFGSMLGAGDTINFNVTEALQLWLSNPTMFPLYGFAIAGYSQSQVTFQANSAKLTIDYTTTGLPPTQPPVQNKTTTIDDDDVDTKDKDTDDKTDDDFIKEVPLWAWLLIGLGIILIFYGIIRKGG